MERSYELHSTALLVYYFTALGLQWNVSWKQAANQRAEVMKANMEQIVKDEASV